jgi:hypothetical protein
MVDALTPDGARGMNVLVRSHEGRDQIYSPTSARGIGPHNRRLARVLAGRLGQGPNLLRGHGFASSARNRVQRDLLMGWGKRPPTLNGDRVGVLAGRDGDLPILLCNVRPPVPAKSTRRSGSCSGSRGNSRCRQFGICRLLSADTPMNSILPRDFPV